VRFRANLHSKIRNIPVLYVNSRPIKFLFYFIQWFRILSNNWEIHLAKSSVIEGEKLHLFTVTFCEQCFTVSIFKIIINSALFKYSYSILPRKQFLGHIAIAETLKLQVNSPKTAQIFEKYFLKVAWIYFVNLYSRSPFSFSQETSNRCTLIVHCASSETIHVDMFCRCDLWNLILGNRSFQNCRVHCT